MAHAEKIGADLWRVGHDFGHREDHLQWNWFGRDQRIDRLDRPALRGSNQLLNAAGVLASFDALRKRLPVSEQAMREGLARVELPARFQIVPGRPTLVLDVAHNPQSVAALALNLGAMGSYPRTLAVFGAMRDKDIAGALDSIRPLIDAWHVCNLPTGRAATAAELATLLGVQAETHCHASPADALRAATQSASPADRIVVFGSFFTVGGVLKGNPRLATACISGESSVARPG
jgi:dihydrofolate synthase/folylpolyglutamate synthase